MQYYENESASLNWDEQNLCTVLICKSPILSEQFRDLLEKGIELQKAKKSHRLLADVRKLGTIRPEDQVWLNKIFFREAAKHGLKTVGIVVPDAFVSQSVIKKIIEKENASTAITINLFKNHTDALNWISK